MIIYSMGGDKMETQQPIKIDNEILIVTLQEEIGRLQQENILLKSAVKQLTAKTDEPVEETK